MILAETIAVEGVTIGGAVLVAIVGAIAGYATMRANVARNTERHDKLESETLPAIEAELKALREWRIYIKGKERGASGSGDSTTQTWEGRPHR